MLPDRDNVDRAVREEEERREDASTPDSVPQDLRMIERVSEEQKAEAPRYGGQTNEIRRTEVAGRPQTARQDDFRFERAGHEEDRKPCQHEGEAGSIPLPSHGTPYHAAPPSTFAEVSTSRRSRIFCSRLRRLIRSFRHFQRI